MRTFTLEWLKASNDDLLTISKLLNDAHLTHIVAFHAQQSIEKSFKALLEEAELEIPKIYKLKKLYKQYFIKDFTCDENLLATLDELYIESRYPGDFGLLPEGKPTLDNAKEFYHVANEILTLVCHKVGISQEELLT
jgi:HEPN domain-containing protein